ncbi:MAG: VOC family protein [Actinomycetota bacterium]|jgi:catechol-2,3-dioxygenase
MADFPAAGHVALTVTDLQKSAEWYGKLFGSKPVLDEDTGPWHHIVYALPGGFLVGLHGHPSTDTSEKFSEFRPGLDHLAFAVSSRADLEQCEARLNELGIKHGGIVDASYGSGLSFRDPDNIALEFFAPPG